MLVGRRLSWHRNGMTKSDTIEERARELAQRALNTLEEVMVNGCKEDASRVKAATAILDRGYGKPTQAIIAIPQRNTRSAALAALSDAELLLMIGELRNREGGRDAKVANDGGGLETACDPLYLTHEVETPYINRGQQIEITPAAHTEFPFADPLCE